MHVFKCQGYVVVWDFTKTIFRVYKILRLQIYQSLTDKNKASLKIILWQFSKVFYNFQNNEWSFCKISGCSFVRWGHGVDTFLFGSKRLRKKLDETEIAVCYFLLFSVQANV